MYEEFNLTMKNSYLEKLYQTHYQVTNLDNGFRVESDPSGALRAFLEYILQSSPTWEKVQDSFRPTSDGFSAVMGSIAAYRLTEVSDLPNYFDDENDEFDFQEHEIWQVSTDFPQGSVIILGERLRQLIESAYSTQKPKVIQ
jgi:hypothetical protein